ncbi:MAG: SAM-dependent methyltransferase [Acidimicrobiales bacterium]
MLWNTPLSEGHARLLLERLEVEPGTSVLDLGCGWGELLIRAVNAASHPERPARGIGVDTEASSLERGRALAAERGLDQRITLSRPRPSCGGNLRAESYAWAPAMPGEALNRL